MSKQETQKEIAQAKMELLEARAKLQELTARLVDLSEVMEKIATAQGRLEKIEHQLLIEFTQASYFHRRGTKTTLSHGSA